VGAEVAPESFGDVPDKLDVVGPFRWLGGDLIHRFPVVQPSAGGVKMRGGFMTRFFRLGWTNHLRD